MSEVIESKQVGDYLVEIEYDMDPMSPREWDNLTFLYCFHDRYDIGDPHDYSSDDFEGWDDFRRQLEEDFNVVAIRPLWMYDHGGIALRVGRDFGDIDPGHWDSGLVGWVVVTKEQQDLIGTDDEHIDECIEGEIETYNDYLAGQCFAYSISRLDKCNLGHTHKTYVDGVGGYYGDTDELLEEAVGIAEGMVDDAQG